MDNVYSHINTLSHKFTPISGRYHPWGKLYIPHIMWKGLPLMMYLKISRYVCNYLDLISFQSEKQNRNNYRSFTYLRIAAKYGSHTLEKTAC